MTEDLKKHLELNPQLGHVYLNDRGEWLFHQRKGYDTVFTRDEVMAAGLDGDTGAIAPDAKKAKKENKKTEDVNPADTIAD
ncbi:hypothetical protein [Mucilaginibacter paludis]|uniref:Uncharacterized protein n=1 Tax=Mucilaginibacter paludis DSM 18603 TaxID=714943 RepID=H1YAY8_9SPHI|nr:hypothetical protein [Mucilaginibacter paludis]EHQ30021.1 hypothetical protein Mucpa_5961 [Mucilaginibacter paludis DSM 18603]